MYISSLFVALLKILSLSCSIILLLFFTAAKSKGQAPVIIAFGWDYRDVSQLKENLPAMQSTPFDGIAFSFQRKIMEAFDTNIRNGQYFDSLTIKKLQWGKYKNNFIIMRGFSKTGPKWFDDKAWKNICTNLASVSATAAVSKNISGILFDPEYYHEDPMYNSWTYNKNQYPDHSFEEVQVIVKKRGTQFIRSLQKYKLKFNLLSLWIAGLVLEEQKYKKPVENTLQALLPSFFEGVVEGKLKGVKITDGNQPAYWYTKPSQFLSSIKNLRQQTSGLIKEAKAKKSISKIAIAQPIFYDGLLAKSASFDKGVDYEQRWKWLEENSKFAMSTTDNLVWFYSQRIINWNKSSEIDSIFNIVNTLKLSLQNNKQKTISNTKPGDRNNINNQYGLFYTGSKTKPMLTGDKAFTFSINTKTRRIKINYLFDIPSSTELYINNQLYKTINPVSQNAFIKIPSMKKTKLIIFNQYGDGREAIAIEIIR